MMAQTLITHHVLNNLIWKKNRYKLATNNKIIWIITWIGDDHIYGLFNMASTSKIL
jgi:hypothetical protein